MWTYGDSRAAVRDALRLSRAMTYKSAVAGLPLGGGKGVIMLPADLGARRRKAALRDFGDTVERLGGTYVTAEDVGTSAKDMEVIAEHTKHVTGLSRRRGGSALPTRKDARSSSAAWATSGPRSRSCSPRPARSSSSPTSTAPRSSSPKGSERAGSHPPRP
jgi:leucine dehydrogenase